MCVSLGGQPQISSHMQIPCKVNAFLCSIVRGCQRVRVAIAMLNNFKQLILPTQLNRAGWVVESEIIIFSTTKFISNAFIKCVLMSHWILPRPSKHRASVMYNLVQQCSKAGTFKWSDDSCETQHKMIVMLVKINLTMTTVMWCVHLEEIRTWILTVSSVVKTSL